MTNQTISKTIGTEIRRPTPDLTLYYEFRHTLINERDAYHITVTKTDENSTEAATAYDVSSSMAEAKRIFSLIANGTVTPTTLYEILDEIL